MYQLMHTKEEKKIWMDGDGYRGKDTRPHTMIHPTPAILFVTIRPAWQWEAIETWISRCMS
jgi:hypothetical protein